MAEEKTGGATTFTLDGWTFYSYENPWANLGKIPSSLEGDKSDTDLLAEGSPLLLVIAEKQMNHLYRIYLDLRWKPEVNRRILTCDGKPMYVDACVSDIGKLMAFAEYLEANEQFGVFDALEDRWLEIHAASAHCLNCPHDALPAGSEKDEKSLFEQLGRSVYNIYAKQDFGDDVPVGEVAEVVVHALLLRTLGADKLTGTGEFLWDCIRYEAVNADDVRRVAEASGLPEENVQRRLLSDFRAHRAPGEPLPAELYDYLLRALGSHAMEGIRRG